MKLFIISGNDEQWNVIAKDELSCYNILKRDGFGEESLVPAIAAATQLSLHPKTKWEEKIVSYFQR